MTNADYETSWSGYPTVARLRAMLDAFPDDAPVCVHTLSYCLPVTEVKVGNPFNDLTPGTERVAHVWLDYPPDAGDDDD